MVGHVGKIIGVGAIVAGLLLILSYFALYGGNPFSFSKLENLNAIIPSHNNLKEGDVPKLKSENYLNPKLSEHATSIDLNSTSPLSSIPTPKRSKLPTSKLPIVESPTTVTQIQNGIGNTQVLIAGYGSELFIRQMHPRDWEDPNWSEIDEPANSKLTFTPIEVDSVITPSLLSGPAINLRIPSISVDSKVMELGVVIKNGIKEYETPKNVVGRIPTDPNMLNSVTGWYFGHLESPIKGEGNVFHALPQIADDIRNGDAVYIILSTEKSEFTYEAIKSEVMHESNLKLYDVGFDSIVLVTCANRPLYDHRQIVTARLIGIAP